MADMKRLFELADEFGMTTGQAMDLCDRLGIEADSGTTLLTSSDLDALRQAAHQAGLGARAVGPAAGSPHATVAPPPGWVRVDQMTAPRDDAPPPPAPAEVVDEAASRPRRRGLRKGRAG